MSANGYGEGSVRAFLDANTERYTADGLPLAECRRAERHIADWASWWPYWMERSRWFEREAEDPVYSPRSRSELLVLSSLSAHLAQYLHVQNIEERTVALHRKIAMYARAAELLTPPARRLEISLGEVTLPALLRVPTDHAPPWPCIIHVGGLDAHKEDAHAFLELCLDRGLATLAYDGPGQGEALLRGFELNDEARRGVSAALDAIGAFDEIDAERIGVVGRSLGGYLAARATADEPRIRALAVWGAMYDLAHFASLPRHTRAALQLATGSANPADAAERLRFLQLAGIADRIRCPTLIVHGAEDVITPPMHAERLARDIGAACQLRIFAGSGHCNHDLAHLVRPLLADWLTSQLGHRTAAGR